MSKLLLSVRITENFFTKNEIEEIENELRYCSKSEFIRKTIKYYLNGDIDFSYENEEITGNHQFEELKELIKTNQSLLKDLNKNGLQINQEEEIYQGEEQEVKRDKILGLLNHF